MGYYILDDLIEPLAGSPLRVENAEVEQRPGPAVERGERWRGYRGRPVAEVGAGARRTCQDAWIVSGESVGERSRRAGSGIAGPAPLGNALHQRGLRHVLKRILPLSAHGEYPNAVAEPYYFSKRRWLRVFTGNGFEVIRVSGNGLFYSGYELFPGLSLAARRRLARVLGSACHIFVMRATPRTDDAPARPNRRDTG